MALLRRDVSGAVQSSCTHSLPFLIRSFNPCPRPVTAAFPPRATEIPVRIADLPPIIG